jgi:hypothetical protein
MTVPAVPSSPGSGVIGLEDISPSELAIPRLQIMHKTAMFKDSLSNEEWSELNTIVLGVCKQRVLWEPILREGSKPLCKSLNGAQGDPAENFPWKESGFTKVEGEQAVLDCAACHLQEWGSHPNRPKIPWCTDQRVLVCLLDGAPYLLSLQRSAMPAVNAFVTNFVKTQTPTFTKHTHMRLTAQKMGTVEFAVPVFTVGEETDPAEHEKYAETYLGVRAFVQSRRIEASDEPMAATKTAPAPVAEDEVPW